MSNVYKLKRQQRKFYKSVVSVFCPILDETVYFTSEGFVHLLYESNRQPRGISEQYLKLMCLTHAPDVIKNCTIITETRKIRRKLKGKWKEGVRYELVHEIVAGKKIRVIVERLGTGKHKFLSVMPHDKKSKNKHP